LSTTEKGACYFAIYDLNSKLRILGGYNEPSVFLVSIKNGLSQLNTNSALWLANKSFGTGSLGGKKHRLPAVMNRVLSAIAVTYQSCTD